MNEFYLGLGLGIGLTVIVDIIYYIKYLGQEKKFNKRVKEMQDNVKKYLDEKKK